MLGRPPAGAREESPEAGAAAEPKQLMIQVTLLSRSASQGGRRVPFPDC